jgi:hypothetical protein
VAGRAGLAVERAVTRSLSVEGAGTDRLEVRPDTGTSAWISCAGRLPWGQPQDQRADDAWSVTYDWEVEEPLEVVGHPTVAVRLCSSAPVALLSAKLEDVFPDGTSALITRGLLNLSRRASLTEPEPAPVDTPLDVDLELEAAAYEPLPIWCLEHDVLARTTTAVVDHGATYRGTHGVTVTDAYQGQVMVHCATPAERRRRPAAASSWLGRT